MKNQTKLILERLLSNLFRLDSSQIVNQYIEIINQMRNNNGLPYTIKYMKCVRLHITRFICGRPLKFNSSGVSLDKDYFPKRFLYLKHLCVNNPRVVLTLLTYTRSIIPRKSESNARILSLNTITDPYKGKSYTIPKSFIEKFINDNGLSLSKPIYSDNDHYVSIKGSPNGKSSLNSY